MNLALLRTYEVMAEPKLVLAAGACAVGGGEFGSSCASCGAVANIIPVDGVMRGCPPTPTALLNGVLWLVDGDATGSRAAVSGTAGRAP